MNREWIGSFTAKGLIILGRKWGNGHTVVRPDWSLEDPHLCSIGLLVYNTSACFIRAQIRKDILYIQSCIGKPLLLSLSLSLSFRISCFHLKPFPGGLRTRVCCVCISSVCGSVCVHVMVLPCVKSPCMGLKEVRYERNCQVWATVGKSGPITSPSSSASPCFYI